MKEEIKNLRVRIDGLSQLVLDLEVKDHQIQQCYDSLILAKAWLGKVLGELGEETPYKNDGNRKTVEDIEPTADTEFKGIVKIARNDSKAFIDMNHIEKIDWLREEIKNIINSLPDLQEYVDNLIDEFYKANPNPTKEEDENGFREVSKKIPNEDFLQYSYKYLSEARFWLGFELGRLKDNN